MERTFADFLWSSSEVGPHFHWIRWDQLGNSYAKGGAGLRSLRHVYDAFSMRLWWHFRLRQSLWAEFMHCKYCPNLHPYFADTSPGDSWTWKRMVAENGGYPGGSGATHPLDFG